MTKGVVRIWVALSVFYAAFLAWHQPMRGPLSEAEVRAAFGDGFAQMRAAEGERPGNLIDFFLSDDGRPFYMVNLNDLPESNEDAAAAARTYGAFMGPRLLWRASYPVLSTDLKGALNNSLGPDLELAERLVVVRYRSRRDFLAIMSSPEFQQAVEHKYASLEGWHSAPAGIRPVVSVPHLVLTVFVTLGLGGTAMIRRRCDFGPRQDPTPVSTPET